MASNRSDLLVAEFLDGEHAEGLGRRDDVRRAAKLLVDSCFEDLGVEPRLLDREQMRELLLVIVVRKLGRNDPLVALVPPVVRALFSHFAVTSVVPNAFEIEGALDDVETEFAAAAKALPADQRVGGKPETIVNRGEKVGRNDPCPCGSGKKFKQCCARIG